MRYMLKAVVLATIVFMAAGSHGDIEAISLDECRTTFLMCVPDWQCSDEAICTFGDCQGEVECLGGDCGPDSKAVICGVEEVE